jgi:hypothetical protein
MIKIMNGFSKTVSSEKRYYTYYTEKGNLYMYLFSLSREILIKRNYSKRMVEFPSRAEAKYMSCDIILSLLTHGVIL